MNTEFLLSSNLENRFLIKDSLGINIPDCLTNHRTFRILLLHFNDQPIKYADLGPWKEYPFALSDFNSSSNQTTI